MAASMELELLEAGRDKRICRSTHVWQFRFLIAALFAFVSPSYSFNILIPEFSGF
jgi:hypothetical protein